MRSPRHLVPRNDIARAWFKEAISRVIASVAKQSQTGTVGMEKTYYVYILTNKTNKVLYTGVTSDLKRRVYEHKHKLVEGFTKKYNVNRLVYYEVTNDVYAAISREKQIKGGPRQRKVDLINSVNKEWRDLYYDL